MATRCEVPRGAMAVAFLEGVRTVALHGIGGLNCRRGRETSGVAQHARRSQRTAEREQHCDDEE